MNRTFAGTLIAFSVAPATIPVSRRPMRAWKCLTAAVSSASHAWPLALGRIEIALDRQTLAQFRHCGSLGARMQRDDVGRPAAGVDDRAIALGRLGGGEERVGLKRSASDRSTAPSRAAAGAARAFFGFGGADRRRYRIWGRRRGGGRGGSRQASRRPRLGSSRPRGHERARRRGGRGRRMGRASRRRGLGAASPKARRSARAGVEAAGAAVCAGAPEAKNGALISAPASRPRNFI